MIQLRNEQASVVIESSPQQADPSRTSHSRRISIGVICVFIFVLAFAIRIALLYTTRSYLEEEHSEVTNVASSLASGRGFANAYWNTGPTAHTSPLYPLLLSLVYRSFGTGVTGEIAQEVLSCFLAALTWALLPFLAEVCHLDRRVGIGAALAGALFTINRWTETKGSFETAMASLACLLMVIFYMRCWQSRDFSILTGVLAGAISGLAILVSGSLASIVIGLLLAGFILFRAQRWQYVRFALLTLVVILATLLPWALRNYSVLGALVWTRDNFPLELMVSNNDDARPTLDANQTALCKYHPFTSPAQRAAVRSMGELAFEKKMKAEAITWITSHPQRFAWLTLQRAYLFWFPQMKRPTQTAALAILTLLSIPGMFFLLKQRQLIGYGLLAILLTYPLVYYIVQMHPRYAYPIQWSLYLLSAQSVLLAYLGWKNRQAAVPGQNLATGNH